MTEAVESSVGKDAPAYGTIAVIGGSGAEGGGLATRWAAAGYEVVIGSRDADRASAAAQAIAAQVPGARVSGAANAEAAARGDVVVLAVPFAVQQATALEVREQLRGKVLIDVTAPLVPPAVSVVQLPASGSCVVDLQRALGEDVRVVAAFQNISAVHLRDLDWVPDCDVVVASDDPDARATAIGLAGAAGFRAIPAGKLANSAAMEALTSVLIAINRACKVQGAGIRITGLPD